MLPSLGFLLAALITGVGVAALIGLVRELRGITIDPARPVSFVTRLLAAARSPQTGGRVAAGVLVGVAVLVLTRWPVAAVGLGLLVGLWSKLFGSKRIEDRQIAYLEALVGFTESLRDTVYSGDTLEQALPAATRNASPILRPALVRLVGQMRARVPLEDALLALAAELDDPSADRVIRALMLNVRRRGDQLADVLTGLATTGREEVEMRRQVAAGRTETRRGVQLIIVVTGGIAVFFAVFGHGYAAAYTTPTGQVALAAVAGIFGLGFAWLRKLSTPPHMPALLPRPGRAVSSDDLAVVTALTLETAPAAEDQR